MTDCWQLLLSKFIFRLPRSRPYTVAARNGHAEAVRYLLEAGASPTLLLGGTREAPGREGVEIKHSTNVESALPPPPRGSMRACIRPTLNPLLLLPLLAIRMRFAIRILSLVSIAGSPRTLLLASSVSTIIHSP